MESLTGSNEEEKHKVRLMRAFVERQDPSSKDVDDFMLRRFLRARDMDVEKGSTMFLKYLKWRRSFVPNGTILASQVAKHISDNKLFSQGVDKNGRPIVLVFAARHFPVKGGVDDGKRFMVFALDKLFARMPPRQEKFVFISDMKGWGYANCDIRTYQGVLSVLQDCYPERLGKLIIVHAPAIFAAAWKIVYTIIDNNTRKKITFVDNKKVKATLLEDIDESQLPDIYGGGMPLVPIQDI